MCYKIYSYNIYDLYTYNFLFCCLSRQLRHGTFNKYNYSYLLICRYIFIYIFILFSFVCIVISLHTLSQWSFFYRIAHMDYPGRNAWKIGKRVSLFPHNLVTGSYSDKWNITGWYTCWCTCVIVVNCKNQNHCILTSVNCIHCYKDLLYSVIVIIISHFYPAYPKLKKKSS
jgi:hypothetical protein